MCYEGKERTAASEAHDWRGGEDPRGCTHTEEAATHKEAENKQSPWKKENRKREENQMKRSETFKKSTAVLPCCCGGARTNANTVKSTKQCTDKSCIA